MKPGIVSLLVRFSLLMPALAAAAVSAAGNLAGRQVLFVIDEQGAHRATDMRIKGHLESRGARVTLVDDEKMGAAVAADLVLISSTVDASKIGDGLRGAAVPIVSCDAALAPRLGLSGKSEGEDFGTTETPDTYLKLVNSPHPLAGGVAAGIFVATNASVPMGWAKPGPAAAIIAIPPGYPARAVIYCYEKGACLATGEPAPARRVGFFFHDETFDKLEIRDQGRFAQGRQLFDAALDWAIAAPTTATPKAKSASGKKLLFVTLKQSPHPKPEVRAGVAATNAGLGKHFTALGFEVTVADEGEPASGTAGYDVVVIAATIRANRVLGRFRDIPVPVVLLENDILDNMGMTAQRRWVDFGEVEDEDAVTIVNPAHVLAAGLPAGSSAFCREQAMLGFGLPAPAAIVIGTAPGHPGQAMYFAYEKGATMDYDFVAPERRVYFPIDFDGYEKLNDRGHRLLDAALLWASHVSAP